MSTPKDSGNSHALFIGKERSGMSRCTVSLMKRLSQTESTVFNV